MSQVQRNIVIETHDTNDHFVTELWCEDDSNQYVITENKEHSVITMIITTAPTFGFRALRSNLDGHQHHERIVRELLWDIFKGIRS